MNYNLSSTHPIIPVSKADTKTSTPKKYLTYLHKQASGKEFEVDFKLCNNYNIESIGLYSYRFPPAKRIKNISSALNNNIITFQLNSNLEKYYNVLINDGCYTNEKLSELLTYKFNLSVSSTYTEFMISYNDMEDKFYFKNTRETFTLSNKYTFDTYFTSCGNNNNKILPILMGMELTNTPSSSLKDETGSYYMICPSTSLIGYIDFLYLYVKQINFIDITRDNKELYQHYFAQLPLSEIEKSNHVFTYSTNVPINHIKNTPNSNMNSFNFRFEDSLGRAIDVGNIPFEITLELELG